MTSTIQTVTWYRSRSTSSLLTPSVRRTVRNWLMACLPEPRVRGKTIVMNSRRTFPKLSWSGLYSEFHGFFSEFHSVLGALAYATAHEAAGVRVDFRSPLYVDSDRGPNWWTYFFEDAAIPLEPERPLEAGTVVSVETALMHPSRGFIKLEDTVVVTDSGHEVYGDGARGWNKAGTAIA